MKSPIRMTPAVLIVVIFLNFDLAAKGTRLFRPDDMFQVRLEVLTCAFCHNCSPALTS